MEYNNKYNTQKTSHYTNSNELISSESRAGNQLTFIHNSLEPPLKIVQTYNEKGGYLKEIFKKRLNGDWEKVDEMSLGPKASMNCNSAMSIPLWDANVRALSRSTRPFLDFALGTRQGNTVQIGNNTKVKDCNELQPDGEAGLIEDLESAFDTGMSCIETLYQTFKNVNDDNVKRRAADMRRRGRRAMGNFVRGANKMFTIECNDPVPEYDQPGGQEARRTDPQNHIGPTTHAFASTCEGYFSNEDIVPGIQLNGQWYSSMQNNPKERRSTLFHEMMHHAGVYHDVPSNTVDWVYSMQFCCFGLGDRPVPSAEDLPRDYSCRQVLAADHGQPSPDFETMQRIRELIE